jgi:low density lipoprotein receptor-related protein 5/6
MYLADDRQNKVYKAVYDTLSGQFKMMVPLIDANIVGPFSIACDWLTGNIYLVEKLLARIDVFSFNGLNRTNLLTSNLYAPNSLALDPALGLMFFVDSGNPVSKLQAPKIERAFMDGTGRQIILKDKLLEPIAITLDIIKKRIFWIDRKYDHLESNYLQLIFLKSHVSFNFKSKIFEKKINNR